jgi:hypothetical protein
MKPLKASIATLVFFVFFLPFCQSQNIQYRKRMLPKVKKELDSIYPIASNISVYQSRIHDSIQMIRLVCNCHDTSDLIVLVFDTNGNVLNKEVHYYGSLNGLPDTILNYIKNNESPTVKFNKKNMIKYYNNKGEMSYGIYMNYSPNSWTLHQYILKFKSNGEFISKEEIPLVATD